MIIGFHGCKGSGKDTAGQFLVDTYEFQKVAFADILKEAVANLFDMPVENVDKFKSEIEGAIPFAEVIVQFGTTQWSWSWREFLQRFGTEMARNTFGYSFWVDQWEHHLYRNSIHNDDIVVTDVRFKNEAEKIQRLRGYVFRITRPGYESDGHESEEPLPQILIDGEISNNGSIEDLQVDVMELYKELTRNGTA